MKEISRHESQRGYFAHALYLQMEVNPDVVTLTADLGYGQFDNIKNDFPDRFINCGASEITMLGMAVGMAMENKISVCYSITPFLLYRGFEVIRNYINGEGWSVILIGGGRDRDYAHDGPSHWAEEDKQVMTLFPNIDSYWPETKEEIGELLGHVINSGKPSYINLKR